MEDCIFCKIIKKEISSSIVYEDDEIIVFKDINPVTPIHILFIPKKHITSINEMDQNDVNVVGNIFLKIRDVAKQLGINENGYRVIANCGEDGGQMVKHLHFHLLAGKRLGSKIVHE